METQNNALIVQIQNSQLEPETQKNLLESFTPFFDQATEWQAKADGLIITDISQVKEMALAREARLALKNIRVAAEKTRKSLKEESLRKGKAIDGIYNVIEFVIVPIEKSLEEKEKFAEIQEAKRKEALKSERAEKLTPFGVQAEFYDLASMPNDAFDQLFASSKLAFEAKLEAIKREEEERIAREKAEAEDRERMRAENERLKKEAEERERQFAEERAKEAQERARIQEEQDAKLREVEEARRKEREAQELKDREERDKQAALLEAERLERVKAQKELEAKRETEAKAQKEAEERAEADLSKGDKEKFESLTNDLQALKTKYSFKSKKFKNLQASVNELIDKTINYSISKF